MLSFIEDSIYFLIDQLVIFFTICFTALTTAVQELLDTLAAACLRNWELLVGFALATFLLLSGVLVIWLVHRIVLRCDSQAEDEDRGLRMAERGGVIVPAILDGRSSGGEQPSFKMVPVLITRCDDHSTRNTFQILVDDDDEVDDDDAACLRTPHRSSKDYLRGSDRGSGVVAA